MSSRWPRPAARNALNLPSAHKPGLILLDVAMPDMDGWQVAQHLRQGDAGSPGHHHAVSASRQTRGTRRSTRLAPVNDDYLIKPFDLRQLLRAKFTHCANIEWVHDRENPKASADRNSRRCVTRPCDAAPSSRYRRTDPVRADRLYARHSERKLERDRRRGSAAHARDSLSLM